jgi:lysophospholipase L1-like esterase
MAPIPAGSQYVAMGSSFGAGPGLTPRAPGSPRRAGRSASNYAHLVARALELDLRDVTYSGATTDDILRPSARGPAAQLDAVTAATCLVTLTGGGNDVGYLPRLTLASLPWPLRTLPKARAQIAGFGDPAATDERFAGVGRNLGAIVHGVRDRAPAARVVFVDYLTILPPAADDAGPPPPAGIADWGRAIAARLAATTRAAAEAAGAGYVAASAASRRFHLSLRGGAPYHPNAAGMAAVAGLVLINLSGTTPESS